MFHIVAALLTVARMDYALGHFCIFLRPFLLQFVHCCKGLWNFPVYLEGALHPGKRQDLIASPVQDLKWLSNDKLTGEKKKPKNLNSTMFLPRIQCPSVKRNTFM
jgi:hypothetical protein